MKLADLLTYILCNFYFSPYNTFTLIKSTLFLNCYSFPLFLKFEGCSSGVSSLHHFKTFFTFNTVSKDVFRTLLPKKIILGVFSGWQSIVLKTITELCFWPEVWHWATLAWTWTECKFLSLPTNTHFQPKNNPFVIYTTASFTTEPLPDVLITLGYCPSNLHYNVPCAFHKSRLNTSVHYFWK